MQSSVTTRTNPLTALCELIGGSINLARAARNFAEVLGWESAEDLAKDAVSHQRGIAASAHKAETHAREALKLIDAAQEPGSDGGEMITPKEAQRIKALDAKAAEFAHDAGEMASA